jgi:uncharacterized hydrophobic protein (TIGR00271 family)
MKTEGRQARLNAIWTRRFRHWHHTRVIGSIEHAAVIVNVMDGGGLTPRYAFMAIMSCGIAILGLLQSSAAVVIGAMLISPLMGPIVQLGFSLCVVDFRMMRSALLALLAGLLLALLTSMCIVWLSPLKEATSEILARTQPTLFDLLVALFSGLAGGYAVVTRKGEAIVGVAIATALMPPLAVVGFGLATGSADIAGGAFFLFMTNLLAIAFSVTLIAKWYGFGMENSPQHTAWQSSVIVVTFILLAIPLGLALRNIAEQAWVAKQTRTIVQSYLDEHDGSIEQLKVEWREDRYAVSLVALVPTYLADAQPDIQARLSKRLKRGTTLLVRQMLEANDNLRRDRADLDDLRLHVDDLTQQVGELRRQAQPWIAARVKELLHGQPGSVNVDVDQHKIGVTLAADATLDGQGIQSLKAKLEQAEPGWSIEVERLAPAEHTAEQETSQGEPKE